MALTLLCRNGSSTWHVGERAPFFPLANLKEVIVDGDELQRLRQAPMPHSLWKDRVFLSGAVVRSANRDAALVIYGMLLSQIDPWG